MEKTKATSSGSGIRFALPAAKKRKRVALVHGTDGNNVSLLRGVFGTALEDEKSSQERPKKQVLMLEDTETAVKRLQEEGNTLAEAGKYRAAMDRWQAAIAVDDQNPVLYELMAQAAMAVYEDFRAVQFAIKATELAPSWGDGFHTLARAHLNFGELELARFNIKKAIDLNGENEELRADLDEIERLLVEQRHVLEKREREAALEQDEGKLQAISCLKHLSLRGRTRG
ncbi:hypothetical protein Poli38472_006208 [Pythium oligandrum]|uniref:Uncharacterized protein n=1 Tax=Pythium oligandrum TaxID=41045 RepID=A0A8K1CSH0_PYTOL|nr:hypothetical protein Poli38472_006208 [Pythium oligandrum]|eukprot:TMW68740.1 hypothetical protein Poli38472_006208 [Pythium oligandrum]